MSALANVIREFVDNNDKGIGGQNELADMAGISRSAMSSIMTSKTKVPYPETVKKLAAAMGVDGVVLTALLGYPTQADGEPGARFVELARRLEAFPWVINRIDDLLLLDESEFQVAMEHFDLARHRRLRPRPHRPRNGGQTSRSGH